MSVRLRQRLEAAWERSDAIFRLLAPNAMYERPIPLRQPFIFYLGHLPAFAWNQVCRGVLGRPSLQPAFDTLFERGIDPVGVDAYRPAQPDSWPTVDDVLAYRDRVRRALADAVADVEARAPVDRLAERGRIVHIAIEHELMHQETLLYMVQQLAAEQKLAPDDLLPFCFGGAASPGTVVVPAGRATLGADFEEQEFGWDNEFPDHDVEVAAFEIDRTAVRNSAYLEFVSAGGYERSEYWSGDAWAWKERFGLRHPHFWVRSGGTWRFRTLFEDVPLERAADWPVYVSWAEASAFARWAGRTLPTEAELHRATYGTPDGAARPYAWGDEPPGAEHGSFGFRQWAPTPVGAYPRGASAFGVLDLVGNGWEWTASVFAPFPGFEPYMRTYPGYSVDFFDGRHYVLLGGSWATDDALIRRSFRNWFQPHYPYVFAKFRCVGRA